MAPKMEAELVLWSFGAPFDELRRPGPALGPAAGDLVFLLAASFVLGPDFYRFAGRLLGGDFVDEITEVFLKSAAASASCA
jgi:hypothetical protein